MRDQLGYVAEWDLDLILVLDAQRPTHQRLSWVTAAMKRTREAWVATSM